MNIKEIITQPIFFERNRVYRPYKGGGTYSDFFQSTEEGDNFFPEEWVASTVKANNPESFGPRDGVSIIKGTNLFFDDLINDHSTELLGPRKYNCLVKVLDSAIRLPVQVHPTKEFSKKHLNSNYGKTEAWIVIATRPEAKLYFGFNDKYSDKDLRELVEKSETDKEIMTTICSYKNVKPGDIFIIKAGLIHAIGAGCTIIEIQEPTDFTIQPEYWCGNVRLSDKERYLGLDPSIAMSCFDLELYGEHALNKAILQPNIEINSPSLIKENLITYNDTTCFAGNKYTLNKGNITPGYGPSVWIVLNGKAKITGNGYQRHIKQGDYFFLPYAAQGKFNISGDENVVLIECLPSQQN